MRYQVTTPPSSEPLTLTAVKLHLRLMPDDASEDDEILEPLMSAAREFCENVTGLALAPQTITAYADEAQQIAVPRLPLLNVESVKAGGEDAEYAVDPLAGTISFTKPLKNITVVYRAGYSELPKTIRQAMLLLVGHWYANREAVVVGAITSMEVKLTVETLLNQHKAWWF